MSDADSSSCSSDGTERKPIRILTREKPMASTSASEENTVSEQESPDAKSTANNALTDTKPATPKPMSTNVTKDQSNGSVSPKPKRNAKVAKPKAESKEKRNGIAT